ncbi:putative 6-carboxy-5,6,7,8-tetrahydropterin synthase [Candidatus Magnetomoraceae bacterium gMMP-15]
MYELKITTHFSAAHQLRMMKTKCENLHGHNWKIEVYVQGNDLDNVGLVIDFGVLKKHVASILDNLDHKFLNELDYFKDKNPSSENIAHYIAERVDASLNIKGVRVSRVSAWESEDACATYYVN